VAASASGQARVGACEDNVQMCVKGVRKRTGLGKKKTKKKKRERKKKKCTLAGSLYIGFMALAVRCQRSLCGLRGVVGRVLTTGHVQKPWGDMRVMHAMCVQAVVVKTPQWHHNFIFWPGKGGGVQGWCLGVCQEGVQTHRTGKKKTKSRLTSLNPHKNADLYRPCVLCVCVASVRACREACEGGMAMAAKRGQWERLW